MATFIAGCANPGRRSFATAIAWKGRYRIEEATFIHADNLSGRVTAILGCPTA